MMGRRGRFFGSVGPPCGISSSGSGKCKAQEVFHLPEREHHCIGVSMLEVLVQRTINPGRHVMATLAWFRSQAVPIVPQ